MAPVKISYVVSFSSQDPKYPAKNLLSEDSVRPWLGCPQDRSRQLSVELQLERASAIGYVDIGNCGCAFVQVEVGRSSWTRNQPYVTLVPTVTLMTPEDSKLDQNRCGVRMFKEADFPVLAVGQKWDRLRLTCSQPFSPRSRFGLSFIRLRTPQEQQPDPPRPLPRLLSPPGSLTLLVPRISREEEQLRKCLWQLEGAACSPAHLSRPARMVLSAAQSRLLRPRAGTGTPGSDPELPAQDLRGPVVPGDTKGQKGDKGGGSAAGTHPTSQCLGTSPVTGSRGTSQCIPGCHENPQRACHPSTREPVTAASPPLSTGRFLLDLLPTHASHCGEDDSTTAWPSSSSDTWVSCPICQLPFSMAEVEQHASTCGD
ncbi:XRCC1 protein, partial [Sapayoa aenigma]|nr:XRCC1 protein [Sapayoa aenigma]